MNRWFDHVVMEENSVVSQILRPKLTLTEATRGLIGPIIGCLPMQRQQQPAGAGFCSVLDGFLVCSLGDGDRALPCAAQARTVRPGRPPVHSSGGSFCYSASERAAWWTSPRRRRGPFLDRRFWCQVRVTNPRVMQWNPSRRCARAQAIGKSSRME